MPDVLTARQAADVLGLEIRTLSVLVRRKKIIRTSRDQYDERSVYKYLQERDPKKSYATKLHKSGNRNERRDSVNDRIYSAVIEYFTEYGYPPTYEELEKRVELAKSGIGLHIKFLVEENRIEVGRFSPYPAGLMDKIKKLVKDEYPIPVKKA